MAFTVRGRGVALAAVVCVMLSVLPGAGASAAEPGEGQGGGTGTVDRGGASAAPAQRVGGPRAHRDGAFSPVQPWPLSAIHAIVLPNGKVMTYGTSRTGRPSHGFIYDIWDPVTGRHTTLPVRTATNLFCSAQTVVPGTGQILITGGDENGLPGGGFNDAVDDVNLFDPGSNTLRRLGDAMSHARWYPTTTTLPNGDVLVHGGRDDKPRQRPALTPEVYSPTDGWRRLPGAASKAVYGDGRWWYPRSWVAPDGRVFILTKGNRGMFLLDARGRGRVRRVGTYPAPSTNNTTPAAMFDVGRILVTRAGGKALVVDLNGRKPKVRETGALRSYRAWSDATVLANGEVLVTGGASRRQQLRHATNQVEIWNPGTGRWRTGATARKARLYHSTAILLPDATVLTAGGGPPGPVTNLNAEIYYPPYLFGRDGKLAPRPQIADVGDIDWGGSFEVGLADASEISRVTLVRSGSVTHSFDMDQRFIPLKFTQSGGALTVRAPANRRIAPPGRYLLFVFNKAGVPSVAEIVELGGAVAAARRAVQTGTITLAQPKAGRWVDVAFAQPFARTPVVTVGAASSGSAQPVMARVRDVTPQGFKLRLDEWSNLDGRHGLERLSYIAAEPGRHRVGGVTIEAGAVTAGGGWGSVRFSEPFPTTPVVLPQVASAFDARTATVRIRGVNRSGFDLRLQEHEARERAGRRHGEETVGYIALTPGRGRVAGRPISVGVTRVAVTDTPRRVSFGRRLAAPGFVAAAQTTNDRDPAVVRYRSPTSRGVQVRMQEERSYDREVRHGAERVGWVAVGAR